MTYGPTDRAVKLRHSLTPDDVERIVDALDVDGLAVCAWDPWADGSGHAVASIERIKAALCGGSEEDYRK